MNSADKVNRELARLDTELRAGAIDRATFRAERRRLLLDFEERETTTQPAAAVAAKPSEVEITVADAAIQPVSFELPEPAPTAPSTPTSAPAPKRKPSFAGIALSAVGAIVVLALAGWWVARPKANAPATLPSLPTSAGPNASAPIEGAVTPQSLAAALTESQWSDADVARFLQGWNQLSPEAIGSATEDSRIWLLRGETGRRLREARETESLEQSDESRARVEQLERVQSAVGTP